MHTSISPIFSYKLYPVATPRHSKPLPLLNHLRIITLTPNLQRVSFYSTIEFLHYSPTTKLLSSLIYITGSHPSSKTSPLCGKSSSAYGCYGMQIYVRSPHGSIPRVKATNDIWARAKRPRTSHKALGTRTNRCWRYCGAPHPA
jgi:hypothetical protein